MSQMVSRFSSEIVPVGHFQNVQGYSCLEACIKTCVLVHSYYRTFQTSFKNFRASLEVLLDFAIHDKFKVWLVQKT